MDDDADLGYDDDGLDWFYVEEDLALADELAETQIAEPGYAGTNYEIGLEGYEWDLYEFWDDLEFGLDTYWDGRATAAIAASKKRKSHGSKAGHRTDKRRKISLAGTGGGSVVFVNLAERRRIASSQPPVAERPRPWALLSDWKHRFAGEDGAVAGAVMPREMRWAAEADTAEDEEESNGSDPFDDGCDVDGGGEIDANDLAEIDPEMLKTILRERLGSAGLNGMDEEAFMQALANMMSSKDDADGAVGDLADSLLGQTTQEQNGALSGWLTRQGVSLAAEPEDDEAEEATEDAGSQAKIQRGGEHRSPPDSVVGSSQPCGSRAFVSASPLSNPRAAIAVSAATGDGDDTGATDTKPARKHMRKRKASGGLFENADDDHRSPPQQRRVQRRVAPSAASRTL